LCKKQNNTGLIMVGASIIQLIGVIWLSALSKPQSSFSAQLGLQSVFGLGAGMSFAAATIISSVEGQRVKDHACAQGAIAQARVLGGAIGIAACTITFNSHADARLTDRLDAAQMDALHRSPLVVVHWPKELLSLVKTVYAQAFTAEANMMIWVTGIMIFFAFFTLERRPTPVSSPTGGAGVGEDSHPSGKATVVADGASESEVELDDLRRVRNSV
jgi:hypothetical protein